MRCLMQGASLPVCRQRPQGDGNVYVDLNQVNLRAMGDPQFSGVVSGGSPGFGGIDTGFEHSGNTHGGIETQPHDWVHGLVGGPQPGLMSDPDTAALDPIFWLHHANIDRLWEVWRRNASAHTDPTEANWANGPASIGERAFVMPMPDGTVWTYVPSDVSDMTRLAYTYDDLSAAVPVEPAMRLSTLGVSPEVANKIVGVGAVAQQNVELVGASEGPLQVVGSDVRTAVQLDQKVRAKIAMSLATAPEGTVPDRVFLNLENVRAASDGAAFQVYVGLPAGANPAEHPENLAGSIALFGVRKASNENDEHAGQGLTYVLEITDIIDAMHMQDAFDVQHLDVRLVPLTPVPVEAGVSIGRIGIFRQSV